MITNHKKSEKPEEAYLPPENFISAELEKNTSDPQLYFQHGRIFRQKKEIDRAIEEFKKAVSFGQPNPDFFSHLAEAIVFRYVDMDTVRLEQQLGITGDSKEETSSRVNDLQFAIKNLEGALAIRYSTDDRIVMARALLELGHDENRDKAIKILEEVADARKDLIDPRCTLVRAYISKGDYESAHKTLEDIVKATPIDITEINPSEVPDKLLPFITHLEGANIGLLQLIGRHNVVEVPAQYKRETLIVKLYDSTDEASARIEAENFELLHRNQHKFVIPSIDNEVAVGDRIYFPQPAMLKREGADHVFLVWNKIHSKDLSEVAKNAVGEEAMIQFMKRIVEFGYTLQKDATEVLAENGRELVDVRRIKKPVHIGDKSLEVDFYTYRLFEKFVGVFETVRGVHISDRDKLYLKKKFEHMDKILNGAPDFFYSFYTDLNLRNILLANPKIEELAYEGITYLRRSINVRTDLENRYKWNCLIDICTALEHEVFPAVNSHKPAASRIRKRSTLFNYFYDYYLSLMLTDLFSKKGRDRADLKYFRSTAPFNNTEKQKALKEQLREKVSSALLEYTQKEYNQPFRWQDYRKLFLTASAHRHLTIIGDKVREVKKYEKILGLIRDSYEHVRAYHQKVESQEPIEKRRVLRGLVEKELRESTDKTGNNYVLESYIKRIKELEELEEAKKHHSYLALAKLERLGKKGRILRDKLDSLYSLTQ